MIEIIANIDKNPDFPKLITKQLFNFDSELAKLEFVRVAKERKRLLPQEAGSYFSACIHALELMMAPHINSFSSTRWFFYLRRLPNCIFEGDLYSTLPNSRAIAEIYALRSNKYEEPEKRGSENVFKVDESLIRHLARFLAFVEMIYDLQVCYRFSGKGAEFEFERSPQSLKSIPRKVLGENIRSAIKIYDQRHDIWIALDEGTNVVGKLAGAGYRNRDSNFDRTNVRLWAISDENHKRVSELIGDNIKMYTDLFPTDGFIRLKYAPMIIDLAVVFEAYRFEPLINHPPSLYTLHSLAVLMLAGQLLDVLGLSTIRVAEVGYFITERASWEQHGEKSYSSIWAQLKALIPLDGLPEKFAQFSTLDVELEPCPWPIRHGSYIKTVGEYVYIDMWSASNAFLTSYQHPREQGPVANGRALRFEDEVQAAIDATPATPNDALRSVRQKQLKRSNGTPITDIDALAVKGDTLIAVSCKSIIYTSEYDKGDYNMIRNGETTVVNALNYWNDVIAELNQQPTGQNFDLSKFKQIKGVVCTPFVLYTSNLAALSETMPGLRSVCSVDELATWLEGP